jgi:ABC-type transport system substrate-binding protein
MIINKKAVYLICSILLSLFLVLGCQLTIRPTLTGVSTPTRVGSLTGASTPTGVGTPTAAPLTGKDAIHTPVAAETATPGARDPTATPSSQPTSTPAPVKVPENNELRLYSPDDAETLDPALVQDMTSHRFVSLLFSGLVTLDSDLQVVPDLAERWEVDDSGTI